MARMRVGRCLGVALACALAILPLHADPTDTSKPVAATSGDAKPVPSDLGEACDRAAGLPREIDAITPDRTILDGLTEKRGDALDAVVAACSVAAAAQPDEARHPYRIGLAQRELGRPAEALGALERAMAHGSAGGYAAIAEGRLYGTLGSALPTDAAMGIAVADEGIAKTGSPEIKRILALFLDRAKPPHRDEARARTLLEEAVAAGHRPAMADLAKLIAEDAGRGASGDTRIGRLLDEAAAGGSRHADTVRGQLLDTGFGLSRDFGAARGAYLKAAEAGDVQGMIAAGLIMGLGEGGPKDIEGKRRWLAKASALGSLDARRILANSLIDEVPANLTVGLFLLDGLAKGGSVEAAHGLGVRFQDAVGVQRDYPRAMTWFREAAQAGDGRAMKQIGQMYDYGQGVPIDHAEARRWYDEAAGKRIAAAYTAIGMQYDHARGVPRDRVQALDWYRKGADLGSAASMSNLGFAYENGRGVEKNLPEAVRWYQEAASRNDRTAKLNLANLYLDGRGVSKDLVLGVKLLQQAAEAGLPQALNDLALLERRRPDGNGARAVKMLREAAVGGAAVAYHNLGMALAYGWDGAPDHVEANYWFRKSIDHASDLDPLAHSESQFQLGRNLLQGRGVARDPAQGKALIAAAAKSQNPTALDYLAKSGVKAGKGSGKGRPKRR